MSGTVTDKRIRSEISKLLKACDNIYDRNFKECAPESFWKEIGLAEDRLAKETAKRPMSTMEIRQACMAYSVAFKRAAVDAGKTDTALGANAG
jgi:hypothetical protein